jgi:hypothetical protein
MSLRTDRRPWGDLVAALALIVLPYVFVGALAAFVVWVV